MRVRISDGGDLRAAARALRRHASGKQIRRDLQRALRAEVQPIVAQIKAAYRAGPSRTGTGRLRGGLARATRAEVRLAGRDAGVRVRVDGRRMPSGMGRLPRLYEGEERWRHPVFGDRAVFVTQRPNPTFYRVVRPQAGRVGRQVERVASDIAKRITRD